MWAVINVAKDPTSDYQWSLLVVTNVWLLATTVRADAARTIEMPSPQFSMSERLNAPAGNASACSLAFGF
jgi:hypothetical protein